MNLCFRACSALVVLATLFFAGPASAQHFHNQVLQATSRDAGASATYTIQFGNHFADHSIVPKPGAESRIRIGFSPDFDLSGASFDWDYSFRLNTPADDNVLITNGGPVIQASTPAVIAGNELVLTPLNGSITGTDASGTSVRTVYQLIINGVRNPATAGTHGVTVAFDLWDGSGWTTAISQVMVAPVTMQPGVDLAADPARPLLYAEEIVASGSNPVTLLNPSGALNLRVPLRYSFSAGEVRHARIECGPGMRFLPGSSVNYGGAGSASVGSINGLGTHAISFSLTAGGSPIRATDTLTVTGTRAITGTSAPVDCAYSLYDQPSQAQAGGTAGRIVTVGGRYIDFGPSTVFESSPRANRVDVETQPAFTRFVMTGWSSISTAGLARLTYGLASPVPLTPAGTPISLSMLHSTGASGTRIVVEGDFGATANQDRSFTGDALSRIYLSTSATSCSTVGMPASTLSAGRATFEVGATALDRMLCLRPRAGVAIPASEYTARLESVPAQPALYRTPSIGPLPAGTIAFDGVDLQAPLVQVLDGWYTRIALTNTGAIRRSYTVRVFSEAGVILDTVDGTGTIPAYGTTVIDLAKVLRGPTANLRGTVVVTVAGSSGQIQGLYQIVNPESGAISNHVMVRPGQN